MHRTVKYFVWLGSIQNRATMGILVLCKFLIPFGSVTRLVRRGNLDIFSRMSIVFTCYLQLFFVKSTLKLWKNPWRHLRNNSEDFSKKIYKQLLLGVLKDLQTKTQGKTQGRSTGEALEYIFARKSPWTQKTRASQSHRDIFEKKYSRKISRRHYR